MTDKKEKILIIEDEESLVAALSDRLIKEGYEVRTAVTGDEGWEKVNSERPDLVLLDIVMPVVDGWEVFKRINDSADSVVNSIPVMIISNLGDSEDIQKGVKMGAVDYLLKADFSLDQVVEKIGDFLSGKKLKP